ncbi:MAG: Wadjet anti-phage system protein JetA family protein [Akkermansiaceae bacterium]
MSLSNHIFDDTPPDFFAVLTHRYGKLYIDTLDKIEATQRLRHGVGLTRDELIQLCEQTIAETPITSSTIPPTAADPLLFADEEMPDSIEDKITPSSMLRHMLKCKWLEEPKRSDYQRVYYLDNRAEILLDCLRRMAYPEQVTFTDKLHLVCSRLQDPDAFTQHPLSDLESCIDNLRYGLQELRSLQQGMARLTQRQLKSDTLKENLQVLYDDFSENIGQRCYKQLIALDIPIRLPLVREKLNEIQHSPAIVAQMEIELQKRRPELTDSEASYRIAKGLQEAVIMLDSVEPQSEAVDRRAADFARRSFARFRYLQEVSSGRRAEVRSVFELINARYADCKMANLPEDLNLPKLNIPSVGLLSGTDSLFIPRTTRTKGERTPMREDADYDLDSDFALDEMAQNINSSLTTIRANHYYNTLVIPENGLRSDSLTINDDEDILNIIGLLLHGETSESDFNIHSPREQDQEPNTYPVEDYQFDEFTIKPRAKN